MSIANPTNRGEMVEYIKIQLGSPVWEVHMAESQIQICIQDAMQYLIEKSHFNGTELTYLRFRVTHQFLNSIKSAVQESTLQDNGLLTKTNGQVTSVVIVSGGSGYPEKTGQIDITTTTLTGTGSGLSVNLSTTGTDGALASVIINNPGRGYAPGDTISIPIPGGTPAVLSIATVSSTVASYTTEIIERVRNWIVLPDGVIGVRRIVPVPSTTSYMTSAFMSTSIPVMAGFGGLAGSGTGVFPGTDFGSTYAIMKTYLADIDYLFRSNYPFNFNQRTHRLEFQFDIASKFRPGDFLLMECDITPDFGADSDMWNDRFFKKLSTAYAKKAMGENMDRYGGVQLPGGLVMNGARILADANREIEKLEQEFFDQYYMPPSLIVG